MNILIVDDEIRAVQALVRRIAWQDYGFNPPFTAYSMTQAQSIFTSHPIHLMLCDIEMPQGSGLELFEWVKSYYPRTECIFVTCHDEYEYLRSAMQLGSCDYILKPVNYELLQESLTTIRARLNAREALDAARSKIEDLEHSFMRAGRPGMNVMGMPGVSGASGIAGASGMSGMPGASDASGVPGASGISGTLRASGVPGASGISGMPGASGASSISGTLRASGVPGASDASGVPAFAGRTAQQSSAAAGAALDASAASTASVDSVQSVSNPYIAQTLQYINTHLTDCISIPDIAGAVHLNEQYIMRLFKKEMGCSILQHITSQRIMLSMQYLEKTELPVTEVALKSGFDNYSYFNRIFKRFTNETPLRYRQLAQEKI